MKIELNELKKYLFRNKTMASLMYYRGGNLYYCLEYNGDNYKFPISTVESGTRKIDLSSPDNNVTGGFSVETLILSKDLGATEFLPVLRASELSRWIAIAIDSGEFMKMM